MDRGHYADRRVEQRGGGGAPGIAQDPGAPRRPRRRVRDRPEQTVAYLALEESPRGLRGTRGALPVCASCDHAGTDVRAPDDQDPQGTLWPASGPKKLTRWFPSAPWSDTRWSRSIVESS